MQALERLSTLIVALAALTIAGAFVHREVADSRPGAERRVSSPEPPKLVKGWESWSSAGRTVGTSGGPVTLLEFIDFQCPFCRDLASKIRRVEALRPGKVTHRVVHFPMSMHKHAYIAARLAECANAQGKFTEMHDLLFAKQDSIGIKSWQSFANESGMGDSAATSRCVADTSRVDAIEAGLRTGATAGISGTPTTIINGWQFQGSVPESTLVAAIDAIARGRHP